MHCCAGSESGGASGQSHKSPLLLPSWRQQEQQPSEPSEPLSPQRSPRGRTQAHRQHSQRHVRSTADRSNIGNTPAERPADRQHSRREDPLHPRSMHRSADTAEAQHSRSTDRTSDRQHSRHGQPFQRHGHGHNGHRQQLNDRASPPEMHRDHSSSHRQAQYRQPTDDQHRLHDHRVHTSNAVSTQRDQLPLEDPHQTEAGSSLASPRQYPGKASYKRRMSAEPLQSFPDQSSAHPPSSKRVYPGKKSRPDDAELMFDPENGAHQQMPQRSYPSRSTRDGDVPIPGRSSAQQRQPERVYPGRIGSDGAAAFGRDAHAPVAQHEPRQPPSYSHRNHPRDQTRDQQTPIRSYPGKHSDSGRTALGRGASEAAWPDEEENTQGLSRQRQYPSHRAEQLFDDGRGAEPNWHDEASQHMNRGRKLDSKCHLAA